MIPRRIGSGTATGEANACARILAAQFSDDTATLSRAKGEFEAAQNRRTELGAGGGRGFSADELAALLARVPGALGLGGHSARACGPGEAGDVLVETQGGLTVRIEIKAQLTLKDFTWIQSADWIRSETDFLGALLEQEPSAASQLSDDVRETVINAYEKETGWDLSALWVADVAGMTSRSARRRVGVTTRAQLDSFLDNKYVIHVTQEGLRMFRLSEVPNLTSALSTGIGYCLLGRREGSQLTVWTRGDGLQPKRGGIHLTYYLGQNGRPDLGGHHVHEAFFEGAKPRLLVKKGAR